MSIDNIETGDEGKGEYPPQALQFMRLVVHGGLPEPGDRGAVWQSMLRMQESNPERFVAAWHKAEMEWEAVKTERLKDEAKVRSEASSDLGGDEGTEAALAVLDRVLKELTDGE